MNTFTVGEIYIYMLINEPFVVDRVDGSTVHGRLQMNGRWQKWSCPAERSLRPIADGERARRLILPPPEDRDPR